MSDAGIARALVLGAGGYLGQRIIGGRDAFLTVDIGRVTTVSDLAQARDRIERAIEENPDAPVVNCLGRRHASSAELMLLNGDLPKTLVEAAEQSGTRVIHLGSAAEMLQPMKRENRTEEEIPEVARAYANSKRAGTQSVSAYAHGIVLRVHNLHGLPHQEHSGLHRMCLAVKAAQQGEFAEPVVDTVRDYVHWREVVTAVDSALASASSGVIDICSGVGISMSDIASGLPPQVRDAVSSSIVPADLFAPVVGPSKDLDASALKLTLSKEVLECASL